MDCAIRTGEREYTSQQADKERDALCGPIAAVLPRIENIRVCVMARERDDGNQDGKKSSQMQDQRYGLKNRQDSVCEEVNSERKGDDRPSQQPSMPTGWGITILGKDDQALDLGTREVDNRSECSLPPNHCKPA